MSKILVLENDSRTRERLVEFLESAGHSVDWQTDAELAIEKLRARALDSDLFLVAWDYRGSIEGPEFLTRLLQLAVDIPRIVLSPVVTLDIRNRVLALGAKDLLLKPVDNERLARAVGQAVKDPLEVDPLVAELQQQVIGQSREFLNRVILLSKAVRRPDLPVLLIGESGVGKEVFARLIHKKGSRGKGPFEAINLAGLSPSLIESELFGHEKGSFTGAERRHIGAFERAAHGTLFLDEIGYLDAALQPRLLRAIDQKCFLRVGGTEEVTFQARIVCATSRNLIDGTHDGSFRADLYNRINDFEIRIPPLRERREDIRHLINFMLRDSAIRVERETLQILEDYSYPGNVRELQSILNRAIAVSNGDHILPGDLPGEIMQERELPAPGSAVDPKGIVASDTNAEALYHLSHKEAISEVTRKFERGYLVYRLQLAQNNKERAAKDMGISDRTLRDKLKLCGLGHLVRGDGGDSGTVSGDSE